MILWTMKLLSTVRRAFAGRRYPHQMAWAVAFGLLLGIVPHGNLLAIGLLLVVVSLKLNHALAALTAIGTSFLATKLDPFSHEIGAYLLTEPRFSELAADAWALPLVPWTDLNNTVVLGSLVIGIAALLPVFLVSYPIFRWLAPREQTHDGGPTELELSPAEKKPNDTRTGISETHPVIVVDGSHRQAPAPHRTSQPAARTVVQDSGAEAIEFIEINDRQVRRDQAAGESVTDAHDATVAVETRIDVIRMKEPHSPSAQSEPQSPTAMGATEQQPMDEALNYLLRQLRDSQQRKAA